MVTARVRYILECTKTGRAWTYATEAQCLRAARLHDLTDYTIERDAR